MRSQIKHRLTKQKKIIIEELAKTKLHPTADMLFRCVRRRLPHISFGTIYRNLNMLKQEGKIIELVCDKYKSRYDANTKPHYHFFCIECENAYDLDINILEDIEKKVNEKGFLVKYHLVNFYGYCQKCKTKYNKKEVLR